MLLCFQSILVKFEKVVGDDNENECRDGYLLVSDMLHGHSIRICDGELNFHAQWSY